MNADPVPEPALAPATRPEPVSLTQAFWYWLTLGFISFGGPTGQIALMHTDLVERKRCPGPKPCSWRSTSAG